MEVVSNRKDDEMPAMSAIAITVEDNRGNLYPVSFDGNVVHIGDAPGMFDVRSFACLSSHVCIGLGDDYEAAEPWGLTLDSSQVLIGLCRAMVQAA